MHIDLPGLIDAYGYLAVFVGAFLEGETILALAGLAAYRGYLQALQDQGNAGGAAPQHVSAEHSRRLD